MIAERRIYLYVKCPLFCLKLSKLRMCRQIQIKLFSI